MISDSVNKETWTVPHFFRASVTQRQKAAFQQPPEKSFGGL
jgi:hypothetical protein